MITKDLKVSKLLEQYPHSLNVLLSISPHFSKLQNKFLRKALAGRVTVEQAASIAGVDLDNLLKELNNANNQNSSPGFSKSDEEIKHQENPEEKPEFLKFLNQEYLLTFDVRPVLESGKDPLQTILSKIGELKTGGALLIINSFEPVPLYSLLGKKGFAHWTEREQDHVKVYFYRKNGAAKPQKHCEIKSDSGNIISEKDYERIIELDVSELQPPEPMLKILENLSQIDDNSVLLVYHHREPHLLYPKLEERGYQAVCHKLGEDSFKILISPKGT